MGIALPRGLSACSQQLARVTVTNEQQLQVASKLLGQQQQKQQRRKVGGVSRHDTLLRCTQIFVRAVLALHSLMCAVHVAQQLARVTATNKQQLQVV